MDNQNPQSNNNSLLDQIIAANKSATAETLAPNTSPSNNTGNPVNNIQNTQPPTKKPKQPMSAGTIFKMLATIFVMCLIFMGMFLGYVVLNPQEAIFFQTVFGVSRNEVAGLLTTLIHGSFGVLSSLVSIIIIIAGVKTFWTPKEQKRKRLFMGIITTLATILFFIILMIWAFLFEKLQAANFLNPNGNILIYDNDLYIHEETRDVSQITDTTSLIGPITLRFNIKDNAQHIKKGYYKIDSYSINFKGAKCTNGTDTVEGFNPLEADEIICTFDSISTYQPIGEYSVIDANNQPKTVEISLPPIQIQGLLNIKTEKAQNDARFQAYDASTLRKFGEPVWQRLTDNNHETRDNYYPVPLTDQKEIIYFYLDNNNKTHKYFRYFVVQDALENQSGILTMTQNPTNPQEYIFKLENLTENPDSIRSIDWRLNNSIQVCINQKGYSCSHSFTAFGQIQMEANITFLGNKTRKVTNTFFISEPLKLDRHAKVIDTNGKLLNPEDTYDAKTRTYIIKDIIPPQKIFLDARDVITSNGGYVLKSVSWNISDGKTNEKRNGDKIEFTVNRTARYTISAEYTFEKSTKTGRSDDIRTTTDSILLDLERKNLSANLKVHSTSDYVPTLVTVDASESHTEYGEIIKFIYDFGEGRPPAEGDAIQKYQYTTPGEKTITVTIVDKNGDTASTKHILVLKDTPKNLNFTTSLSPAEVGKAVDFIASGTTGQIEDYLWNFNDNTPISHGYEVSHTFTKPGTYNVILTVRYVDGTEKTTSQSFKVVESLE